MPSFCGLGSRRFAVGDSSIGFTFERANMSRSIKSGLTNSALAILIVSMAMIFTGCKSSAKRAALPEQIRYVWRVYRRRLSDNPLLLRVLLDDVRDHRVLRSCGGPRAQAPPLNIRCYPVTRFQEACDLAVERRIDPHLVGGLVEFAHRELY